MLNLSTVESGNTGNSIQMWISPILMTVLLIQWPTSHRKFTNNHTQLSKYISIPI